MYFRLLLITNDEKCSVFNLHMIKSNIKLQLITLLLLTLFYRHTHTHELTLTHSVMSFSKEWVSLHKKSHLKRQLGMKFEERRELQNVEEFV